MLRALATWLPLDGIVHHDRPRPRRSAPTQTAKAFEQSVGSVPISDSATCRCRLVLPNSFVRRAKEELRMRPRGMVVVRLLLSFFWQIRPRSFCARSTHDSAARFAGTASPALLSQQAAPGSASACADARGRGWSGGCVVVTWADAEASAASAPGSASAAAAAAAAATAQAGRCKEPGSGA